MANIPVASGRALETSLIRQISVRREELQVVRRRNTSVIVHTSTPNNLTQNQEDFNFFEPGEEIPLSSEQAAASNQQSFEALPFQIHQDPEPGISIIIGLENPQPRPPTLSRPPLRTIEIVPTPHTPFSDQVHFNFTETPAAMAQNDDERAELDRLNTEIRTRSAELVTILEMYDPGLYPPDVLKENRNVWIKEAQNAYKNLIVYMIQLEERATELTEEDLNEAKASRKKAQEIVGKFVLDLNLKVMSLNDQAPPPPSHNRADDDDGDDDSLASSAATLQSRAQAKRSAKAGVEVDKQKIEDEIKTLSEDINQVDDWSKVSDHEVEETMQRIADWRKQLKSIKDSFYSMKKFVKTNDLNDSLQSTESAIKHLEEEMKIKIEDLQYEDKDRCLYSLSRSKPADIQYPSFSGSLTEDFFRFQQEVENAFAANKVRKEDRCKKLRNCLKNQPLGFVPESMKDIDEAWAVLKQLYGDPARLLRSRKEELENLGKLPKPGSVTPNHVKLQVEWFMKLELLLKDLFKLASKDEDCYCEVYNSSTLRCVHNLFNAVNHEVLNGFSGSAKRQLESILDYVVGLRNNAKLQLQKLDEPKLASGFGSKGVKQSSHANQTKTSGQQIPYRHEKCRICKRLELEGDTTDLYEDHTAPGPIGCPRFARMETSERRKYIDLAQICRFCFDVHFVKRSGQRHNDCPAFIKDQNYTCSDSRCKEHYLVCVRHFDMNRSKRQRNVRFWERHGKSFSHVSIIPSSVRTGDRGRSDEVILDLLAAPKPHPPQTQSNAAQNVFYSQGLQSATDVIKKLAKGAVVRPLPRGDPLFLFSYVSGKSRDLTCFMDSGCSHVIWRSGVPVKELDAVKTRAGPFSISAAGDTSITVQDEYLCLVNRTDGSKQLMLGVSVDKITTTFPFINTSQAVKDLCASAPPHKRDLVSSLKCPTEIGGDPDILLGIFYNNCFPEVVHQMDNGLFIAKLKLSSGQGYTGAVGGPHHSFSHLSNQVGDTAHLMSCFISGLKMFRKIGPPKLTSTIVSHEDIMFAETMNHVEMKQVIGDEDGLCEPLVMVEADPDQSFGVTMKCQGCGDDVLENVGEILDEIAGFIGQDKVDVYANLAKDNDETLHDLKTLMKIMEQGISLDYRCPKCRNCWSCRQSTDTERISIREEFEDDYIKDCVKIDFDSKKIIASLPMRADVNKYLSNNRDIAVKVLNSQCNKLKNDPEGKAVVIKAFRKLIDRGFAVFYEDLSAEQKDKLDAKPVQYYLPWRTVYKDSVTSPCRPVFDASSKTPVLPNGQGGRCLNDLMMKGKISTLNLLNMLLRFSIGKTACAGDLKAFYTSIALVEDQWNLQRVLWRDELNLDNEIREMIIITLIFGVRPVSALTERAIQKLSSFIHKTLPRLEEMLTDSRYVDDLADSDSTHDIIKKLIDEADALFGKVGLSIKGWSVSGSPPHPEVTNDNITVDVGGMVWFPEIDCISVKVPPLHFGKKSRGKINIGTEIFDGTFEDLEKFVPKRLTRRQIVSKMSSIFDPFGKYLPLTGGMKVHMRLAVLETDDWDDFVSDQTRNLWVKNFWMLHNLRGMKFVRARIPTDAVNTTMDLVAAVDASNELKIAGVWARFLRTNGEYSSQLLIGRALLVREGSSIPKEELEAATIGTNLLWIVRQAVGKWLGSYVLLVDSVIALCWITTENKRLSLFHRNRVNQVRMNLDLENLYWVNTLYNPADVATRSGKVQDSSVGPDSIWEKGYPWMTGSLDDAIKNEIVKPASILRISDKEENDFENGFVHQKTPEILVQGHVVSEERMNKMKERALFSNYIIQPSKFHFRKIIMITSYVYKFIRLCKYRRLKNIEKKFKMFPAASSPQSDATRSPEVRLDPNTRANICWGSENAGQPDGKRGSIMRYEAEDFARANQYWFEKATAEVIQFVSPDIVKKVGVMKDNILYCRSRIHDGQRLIQTGDVNLESFGGDIGLNLMTPLIDRYSPIAYSVAMYIHNVIGSHAGFETCYRLSLEFCHILQGLSLFRQIGDECTKCKMIRKKYLDVVMGPVSDHQLTISPPFFITYADLDGPHDIYTPGHERETRGRKVVNAKVYIMTFCCPASKLCNLQVIEAKNAEAVMEGLTRLGCEVGMPSLLLLDQETSFMKMVRDAEINLKDLSHRGWREHGIRFEVAPVRGHNYHGLVERRIKAVQDAFVKINLKNIRLHATGLQTFCKLVENNLNNLPLGYSYGRDSNNSPILKIITPNLLRVGRLNSRSLSGPMRFPAGPKEFLKKVDDTYEMFYKVWDVAHIPKLIPQPKWFKDSPTLKINDVVYFKKVESDWRDNWTVGQVQDVVKSKDGVVRRATIRYYTGRDAATGEFMMETTDRAVRSLVRLFNIEDAYFVEDMAEVEKFVARVETMKDAGHVTPIKIVRCATDQFEIVDNKDGAGAAEDVKDVCSSCCCSGHCSISHFPGAGSKQYDYERWSNELSPTMVLDPWSDEVIFDQDQVDDPLLHDVDELAHHQDDVLHMITALQTQFDLDVDQI